MADSIKANSAKQENTFFMNHSVGRTADRTVVLWEKQETENYIARFLGQATKKTR
jgi:hypothetical protein